MIIFFAAKKRRAGQVLFEPMEARQPLPEGVTLTAAASLIRLQCFDLVPKIMYARSVLASHDGKASVWATFAYVEHLRAFNGFHEKCHRSQAKFHRHNGTCTPKTSAGDFLRSFNDLIGSIQRHGFQTPPYPAIPVNAGHILQAGAHRAAVMFAMDPTSMVPVRLLPGHHDAYDESFFEDRQLPPTLRDAFVLEYIKMASAFS